MLPSNSILNGFLTIFPQILHSMLLAVQDLPTYLTLIKPQCVMNLSISLTLIVFSQNFRQSSPTSTIMFLHIPKCGTAKSLLHIKQVGI